MKAIVLSLGVLTSMACLAHTWGQEAMPGAPPSVAIDVGEDVVVCVAGGDSPLCHDEAVFDALETPGEEAGVDTWRLRLDGIFINIFFHKSDVEWTFYRYRGRSCGVGRVGFCEGGGVPAAVTMTDDAAYEGLPRRFVVGDADGDGLSGGSDNCPEIHNPGQEDEDGDGIGCACEDLFEFTRGDANGDNRVDVGDALAGLNFLFNGAAPPACADAADVNDDGRLEISDGVYLLSYLFVGGRTPPPPFPEPGIDFTPDALR